MFIDNLGICHEKVVEIPDGVILAHCFKVRVLKRKSSGRYEVMGEEEYSGYPTSDQILWCIANYKGTQAVVEQVYYTDYVPFS